MNIRSKKEEKEISVNKYIDNIFEDYEDYIASIPPAGNSHFDEYMAEYWATNTNNDGTDTHIVIDY